MREVLLGELLSDKGITYGVVKPGDHSPNGIPLIKAADVGNARVNASPAFRISQDKHQEHCRTELTGGELLITLVGKPGQCAIAPVEIKGFNVVRAVGVFSVEPIADNRYIMYAIQGPRSQSHIRNVCNTTVQATLNLGDLKGLPLTIPPLAEQKAIAHILGTIDEKIELNRKTNETLEAMAKALFKSWFVDFDPVRAKAEGRPTGLPAEISDLFPDSFEDSELGEIPSGWGTTCLDELTSFVIGGDWGMDAWSETEQAKVLCLRGADIPSLQAFAMGKPPTRFLKESSCEKRALVEGDIVLEISGGSTDQSTGRPVLISSDLVRRAETPLTCSNFCRLIRFDSLRWSSYAYYLMLSLYQSGEMFQYETGTTGIKNFGYKYFAGRRFFPKPPNTLLDLFHCQVKSLHSSCHRRGEESDLLSKTRDVLLPKLISGEIRIPDVEKLLEEVGI
jgi:type I restriction enzyme, S subunit